jgi:hypothetical protein
MTEKKRSALRKWAWKFFGALFMRDKGVGGVENQAISAHKFLGLILLLACLYIWVFGGTRLTTEEEMSLLWAGKELPPKWGNPPDLMVYSWWALLGIVDVAKGAISMFSSRVKEGVEPPLS